MPDPFRGSPLRRGTDIGWPICCSAGRGWPLPSKTGKGRPLCARIGSICACSTPVTGSLPRIRQDRHPIGPSLLGSKLADAAHFSADWPVMVVTNRCVSSGRYAVPSSHLAILPGPALYAASPRPILPNRKVRSARNFAACGMACSGTKGSTRPRSAAVEGMNWATPCAPAGLTARGRNPLSTQSSRVRISPGNEVARAAASIRPENKLPGVSAAASMGLSTVTQSAMVQRNAGPARINLVQCCGIKT